MKIYEFNDFLKVLRMLYSLAISLVGCRAGCMQEALSGIWKKITSSLNKKGDCIYYQLNYLRPLPSLLVLQTK